MRVYRPRQLYNIIFSWNLKLYRNWMNAHFDREADWISVRIDGYHAALIFIWKEVQLSKCSKIKALNFEVFPILWNLVNKSESVHFIRHCTAAFNGYATLRPSRSSTRIAVECDEKEHRTLTVGLVRREKRFTCTISQHSSQCFLQMKTFWALITLSNRAFCQDPYRKRIHANARLLYTCNCCDSCRRCICSAWWLRSVEQMAN